MLKHVPDNIRLLAPCSRGYKYASPFSASGTPDNIRAQLGHDIASITTNFISKLSLLSHFRSKVKLLSWSVGAMTLLSAYQLLHTHQLSLENEDTLRSKIREVIILEATTGLLFGLPPSAFTARYRKDLESLDAACMWTRSIRQVMGVYHYEPKVLEDVRNGARDATTVYPINESLADDSEFMKIVNPFIDPTPLPFYQQASTPESEEGRQYIKESLRGMLDNGAEKIVILSTKHCVPDCLEASAVLVGEFGTLQEESGKGDKVELRFIEGRYNHFVNVTAPDALWKSLTE